MTVPSETNKSGPYYGDGVTTVFNYDFRIVDKRHLRVILTDESTGIEHILTVDTDYTVTGVGDAGGGQITVVSPLAVGKSLTILRAVPFKQEIDLENQGAYYAETVEEGFDLSVMRDQELSEQIGRALKLPKSAPSGVDLQLPRPDPRKLLGWNEAGSGIDNYGTEELATLVAYGEAHADIFEGDGATTEFPLTKNPVAQANLDVSVSGVTQLPGVDYEWTGGLLLRFFTPPPNGAKILARYLQGLPFGDVADGSITESKLSESVAVQAIPVAATPAALLSSTKQYTVGSVIHTADGFFYEVADPSAVDYHLMTAGGMKLYVMADGAGPYNVAAFGAKGDGVADDIVAIERAIACLKERGGGTLSFPIGRYRITRTIYVPAYVRLSGPKAYGFLNPANMPCILTDFANPNAWAIESDIKKVSDGTRVDYRSATSAADFDDGIYNNTHGVEVIDITVQVKDGTSLYGGIRIMNSPLSRIRAAVIGADIGYVVSSSWGTKVDAFGLVHLYGVAVVYDVNSVEVTGYVDRLPSPGKTIDDSNRPAWVKPVDIGPSVGTRDFKNMRLGFFSYFGRGVSVRNLVTENFDVARVYLATQNFDDVGVYSEASKQASVIVAASKGRMQQGFWHDTAIPAGTAVYEFGVNAIVDLFNFAPKQMAVNQYARVNIYDQDPDAAGWGYYGPNVRFPAAETRSFRVSSSGSDTALGYTTTYTTLTAALQRIEAAPPGDYVIRFPAGDSINWPVGLKPTFENKRITFKRDGASGAAASIIYQTSGGFSGYPTLRGNVGLTYENVTLNISGTYTDQYERGLIRLGAGNFDVAFIGGGIALGNGFVVFGRVYQTASTLRVTQVNSNLFGSGAAAPMASVYNGEGACAVVWQRFGGTVDEAVRTNGFPASSTVLASNL